MSNASRGNWVEIERVLLQPSERAPQVPDDTRATPYVLRVAGFLENPSAKLGDEVTVKTFAGRKLAGKLVRLNPHYEHSFGETVPELLTIGKEEHLA